MANGNYEERRGHLHRRRRDGSRECRSSSRSRDRSRSRNRSRSGNTRSRSRNRSLRTRSRSRSRGRSTRSGRDDNNHENWEQEQEDKVSKFRRETDIGFECTLCMIKVPCEETFYNHVQGKDHSKRLMQHEEQQIQIGNLPRDGRFGYKTGPGEMAKLTPDETKELEDLRTNNLNINRELEKIKKEMSLCEENHKETADFYRQQAADAVSNKETVMRRCDQLKGEIEKLRSQGRKIKKKKEYEYTEENDWTECVTLDSD